jgi:hypothetical protein
MATGRFIDFTMVYADGRPDGLDNDQQAQKIVDTARGLIGEGAPGVAITYSANQGQTKALVRAYAAGDYAAGISGANQAEVMERMETLLGDEANADLRLRIAPITTIDVVTEDLARIRDQLDAGWTILGWRNQKTVNNPDHPYAIGGGSAACRQRSTAPSRTDSRRSPPPIPRHSASTRKRSGFISSCRLPNADARDNKRWGSRQCD